MAHAPMLIAIRERSFLDLLDLAAVVVRRHPARVGLAALAGCLPCAAFNAWVASAPDFPPLLVVMMVWAEVPWATAPLTVVLGGLMFGERVGAGRVALTLFRALPGLVLYQLFLRGLLLASVLLIPVIAARLTFLDEVLLLERGRLRAVLKRCSNLAGERDGDGFGQWLGQVAFGGLFVTTFWFGTGALLSGLTTQELTWEEPDFQAMAGARFQVGLWLAVSFFGVARFLTYIDQRIRREGWEVKLRLQTVGRALGEGRW